MKTVQVLLSTYNGEKYLREQLDSVLNQKNVDVKIMVRDDGSTDLTRNILEEYRKQYKIMYYLGENIGYKKSFFSLAKNCIGKADYYAFCDQDDVWEPDKLFIATNKLEQLQKEKCKLYFSNLKIVDENLENIGYKNYSKINITLGGAMTRNNIAGCTMVFDNNLLKLALQYQDIEMQEFAHDAWFYRLCLGVGGKVIFDKESYIKYRRHQNNETNIGKGAVKRVISELKVFKQNKNKRFDCAQRILEGYYESIPEQNVKLLNMITTYKDSAINTIKLAFNNNLKMGIPIVDILTKVQILLRQY